MSRWAFWRGKRVFVTGHTGFKGAWLTAWLVEMGAEVHGYALKPDQERTCFDSCGLETRMASTLGDIRDATALARALRDASPDVVFHLAAQSLVRRSYRDPVGTFATNVMGTVHLLESVRQIPAVRAVVIVTSDKCYENREWVWGYREDEPMGGHDPYSASKGCAELVTAAYRRSFFEPNRSGVGVASARAGNVIGGGDWAVDRVVPDAVRSLERSEPVVLRNPDAVRPWQHVLEPVAGYLMLAERLFGEPAQWSGAWNFGPREEDAVTVATLTDKLVKQWGRGSWRVASGRDGPHEARYLKLDCSKARQVLGWRPRLTLDESVELTVAWYRRALAAPRATEMYDLTCGQIRGYEAKDT
jgi:CDP-glucose 4,6-dehydratase